MNSVIVVDAIRLDTVVWNTYGTLIPMGMVLEANAHLLGKTHLNTGDTVYLPTYKPPKAQTEVKTLWN
jgi:hypothetical protein